MYSYVALYSILYVYVHVPAILQFQSEVQQKFFNCRRFGYSVERHGNAVQKHSLNTNWTALKHFCKCQGVSIELIDLPFLVSQQPPSLLKAAKLHQPSFFPEHFMKRKSLHRQLSWLVLGWCSTWYLPATS